MPKEKFDLVPVGIRYICDKCGVGEMIPHGKVAWLTDPIQFPHKCNKCGHEQGLTEKYPTVHWVLPT